VRTCASYFWIEKAAIDLTISCPRKRDVGASEKLIDGRMATAYLHNPNASADVVMFYSDWTGFLTTSSNAPATLRAFSGSMPAKHSANSSSPIRAKTSPEFAPSRIRERFATALRHT